MGQIRLSRLRLTPKWRKVMLLLETGASSAEIVAAACKASEAGFQQAADDPTVTHAFGLLTQLSLAARSPDFAQTLRPYGIGVSARPSFFELLGAFSDAIDGFIKEHAERTDLAEMAQLAAVESLTARGSKKLKELLGATPEENAAAIALASAEQFGEMASDFFARFTQRYLLYYLSRELSNHVGGKRRFFNSHEHTEFIKAMEVECRLASRSVEELAQSWLGDWPVEPNILRDKPGEFVQRAIENMQHELLGEERQ